MSGQEHYVYYYRTYEKAVTGGAGMYVYYYRTYEKAVSGGGEREKGGHVLRDTTSRGLYVRVWPPHTSGLWSLEGSLSSLSR